MAIASRTAAWLAGISLLWAGAACAMPIEVSFTAANFLPLVDSIPPTDDPVSGTITYDAASTTSPIDSIISVSLVISGHTYTVAETGFDNSAVVVTYIGGLIDGVLGSSNFEDDFLIGWDTAALVPLIFQYSVSGSAGIWFTADFPLFTVTAVPEPGVPALLALSLCVLAALRTQRADGRIAARNFA